MSDGLSPEHREHDLTMHVFAISAAIVGVCLTAIGILRLITSQSRAETIGDELLASGCRALYGVLLSLILVL
jgi:hypothetical protein